MSSGNDTGAENGKMGAEWGFRVSSREAVAQHFIERDPTGQLFATLHYMGTVEDWVVTRLGEEDKSLDERVQAGLQRLDDVITQYREQIPPDNTLFLKIMSWLPMSECMYTVEYLHQHQRAFFEQMIEHCRAMSNDDLDAAFMFRRITALLRTRLIDRIFGRDNTGFVTRILMEMDA